MRALFTLLTFLCFTTAASAFPEMKMCPYAGVDADLRHMGFKPGYGKGLFERTLPQGNVYVGTQIMEYLAAEGGFESTTKKKQTVTLNPGDFGPGFEFPQGFLSETKTYAERLRGWHINLVGITPCLFSDNSSIQLFGSIGLSRKELYLRETPVAVAGVPVDATSVEQDSRTLIKEKSVLRLAAGVQKLITDCVGVRAIVKWENTGRFGYLKSQENPSGVTSAKLGNTASVGVGVFLKF